MRLIWDRYCRHCNPRIEGYRYTDDRNEKNEIIICDVKIPDDLELILKHAADGEGLSGPKILPSIYYSLHLPKRILLQDRLTVPTVGL